MENIKTQLDDENREEQKANLTYEVDQLMNFGKGLPLD